MIMVAIFIVAGVVVGLRRPAADASERFMMAVVGGLVGVVAAFVVALFAKGVTLI